MDLIDGSIIKHIKHQKRTKRKNLQKAGPGAGGTRQKDTTPTAKEALTDRENG